MTLAFVQNGNNDIYYNGLNSLLKGLGCDFTIVLLLALFTLYFRNKYITTFVNMLYLYSILILSCNFVLIRYVGTGLNKYMIYFLFHLNANDLSYLKVNIIKVAINFADNIGTLNILEHHNDHDVLVARKKGILHHLKPVAEVLGKRRAAEEIKCYLTESSARKSSKASSYHKIISALDKSGLCVTGLMVETADNDVDTEHISLGAAVLICKKEKRGSWVLTTMNCDEIISNELEKTKRFPLISNDF